MNRPFVACLFLAVLAAAFENREAKVDAAVLQLDGFFTSAEPTVPFSADSPFSRAFGYTFLPLAKIAERDLVGYTEASLMIREFRYNGSAFNSVFLQGYGIGLGYEAVKSARHSGFVFGLVGVNSDMRDLGSKDVYGDLSYLHQIAWSDGLEFGGGLDLHFYLDTFLPYPLLYLDWKVAGHTKVKINFDTGEIKQFLTDRLGVSLGAQYDLFHYGMGRSGSYLMDAIYGMARLEYRVGEHVFLRLSGKTPVWGGEEVKTSAGADGEIPADRGVSVRVQVAYGI